MTLSPFTSPLTVAGQSNASPFFNRSSYHEESSQQLFSQQQRHSMYETSSSSTFQKNIIPSTTQAPHLQPLGGRADLTAQPDQDNDPSVSSL